ncbi:MAG: GNAT family N-acetyltransferase [Vicinamibacterales bacterium]
MRRAAPGDEPILRALRLEALSDAPEAFGSTYERELARTEADWQRWLSPGATFLLEGADGHHGIVACGRQAEGPAAVDLMAMWVRPAVRGSRGADALVAAVCDWARAEVARVVRLMVFDSNPRARRFYERHGFRLTGHQEAHAGHGRELQMERDVQARGQT